MSLSRLHTLFTACAMGAGTLLATNSTTSAAGPLSGNYKEDSRGDALPDQALPNELGDVAIFPALEALAYHDHRSHFVVGVADDGVANDWLVHIHNVSGQAWRDLFFVADLGATLGNADGRVEDQIGAPGTLTDAFRVDALGNNANLIHESMTADGVLQVGEEWEFVVTNFGTGSVSTPPVIISPGAFAGSSPLGAMGGLSSGNSSILAVPIPEPSYVTFFAFVAASLLLRRRRDRAESSPRTA